MEKVTDLHSRYGNNQESDSTHHHGNGKYSAEEI
jgi:hypothetical protein